MKKRDKTRRDEDKSAIHVYEEHGYVGTAGAHLSPSCQDIDYCSSGPPPSQFDVSASSSLILMAICALAILQDLAFVKSRRSREDVSACSLIVAIVSSTLQSSTSRQVKT